jgi:hypothetical protein
VNRSWVVALVGVGLAVAGCGGSGSGTPPKAQADFWLINGTHDFAKISVDVPGQARQSLTFGGEFDDSISAFDGDVVVRDESGNTVLDTVHVRTDSETITKLFVTGRSDGEAGIPTEVLPVQIPRRELDRTATNFRIVNITRDNTVDLYFVPTGDEIPDRAPDVAGLAPNAVTPLMKRPAGGFDIIATAPGTKTWQGRMSSNGSDFMKPGYWAIAIQDLPIHASEVSLMFFGSKF